MSSNGGMEREEIVAVLDRYEELSVQVAALRFDALTTPERLAVLQRLERIWRRAPVPSHQLINQLRERSSDTELGGTLSYALADRLRISRIEAGRRIAEAADLGPRTTLTGQPVQPVLGATAAAQRAGAIGAEHMRVIRGFLKQLPEAAPMSSFGIISRSSTKVTFTSVTPIARIATSGRKTA